MCAIFARCDARAALSPHTPKMDDAGQKLTMCPPNRKRKNGEWSRINGSNFLSFRQFANLCDMQPDKVFGAGRKVRAFLPHEGLRGFLFRRNLLEIAWPSFSAKTYSHEVTTSRGLRRKQNVLGNGKVARYSDMRGFWATLGVRGSWRISG